MFNQNPFFNSPWGQHGGQPADWAQQVMSLWQQAQQMWSNQLSVMQTVQTLFEHIDSMPASGIDMAKIENLIKSMMTTSLHTNLGIHEQHSQITALLLSLAKQQFAQWHGWIDQQRSVPFAGDSQAAEAVKLRQHFTLWLQVLETSQALSQHIEEIANARIAVASAKLHEELQRIDNPQQLFDLLVRCSQEHLQFIAASPEYSQSYGEWVNAITALRIDQQTFIDATVEALGLPSKREMDTNHSRVHNHSKRLRHMQQQIAATESELLAVSQHSNELAANLAMTSAKQAAQQQQLDDIAAATVQHQALAQNISAHSQQLAADELAVAALQLQAKMLEKSSQQVEKKLTWIIEQTTATTALSEQISALLARIQTIEQKISSNVPQQPATAKPTANNPGDNRC